MPGKGHDHYVQIGRESAWGSDVAATRKLLVVSTDLQAIIGKIRPDTLTDTRNRKAMYYGSQMGRATIELEASFDGQLQLWDAAFGTATYGAVGGVTAGGPSYTHTFYQREFFNSYTIEAVTNIPSGKCDQLVGAKLNKLVFSGSTGIDAKPCHIVTEWIGKAVTTNVTPTSAGPPTDTPIDPIMPRNIDTAGVDVGTTDAAGTARLKSWEITIDNKLTDDRFYGTAYMDEPLAGEFAETSFKWTMEFTSQLAIDDYLAHTSVSPNFQLLNAAATKSFAFSAAYGYIVTPIGRPISRWGIYTQDFTVEAIDNGGSPATGITLVVTTTGDATIT